MQSAVVCVLVCNLQYSGAVRYGSFSRYSYLYYIEYYMFCFFFFFQAEDGIRDRTVTGVQTCALPISNRRSRDPGEPRSRGLPRAVGRRAVAGARRAAARRWPCRARLQPGARRAARHRRRHARTPCVVRARADCGGGGLTTGVVLMTYGAPRGDADLPRYLAAVRGGREPADELVVEMRRRYALIGGSPLIRITRAQAAALEAELGEGYVAGAGMRYSDPSIGDAVRGLVERSADQLVGICMSPQWSPRLMGGYADALTDAA